MNLNCGKCGNPMRIDLATARAIWTQRHATYMDLEAVANAMGTTAEALQPDERRRRSGNPGEPRDVSQHRRLIAYAVLRRRGFSWKSIAELMNRDHTSIVRGAKRADRIWGAEVERIYNASR